MAKRRNRKLIEPKHERAGLRLLRRAIHGRWDIPEQLLDQLPRLVTQIAASSQNDREKLRAVEVLVSMNRDNINALALADKVERLEEGTPTEVVQLAPIQLRPGGVGAG